MAFSPDGKKLISGSGNTTVRVWDTEPYSVLANERKRRAAIVELAEPLVSDLFEKLGEPSEVVSALRADNELTGRFREVSYQLTLKKSSERSAH